MVEKGHFWCSVQSFLSWYLQYYTPWTASSKRKRKDTIRKTISSAQSAILSPIVSDQVIPLSVTTRAPPRRPVCNHLDTKFVQRHTVLVA